MPEEGNEPGFVICVGASAGGFRAFTQLIAGIDKDIDAAILIVLHLSQNGVTDGLLSRWQQHTSLVCKVATNRETIRRGTIYVAPPNHHLLVKKGSMRVVCGPEENRWRPSIDVLFRSAAVAYDGHCIGIELSGLLNDGMSGMYAIKKCGGTTIVQDPEEAEYPQMPQSVLDNMETDYRLTLAAMPAVLLDIIKNKRPGNYSIPPEIIAESEIAERTATGIDVISQIGGDSVYVCPDCGGRLWSIEENGSTRYRCLIGHSYSGQDLSKKQKEKIEATLWTALRMMEERSTLLKNIALEEEKKGMKKLADNHFSKSAELQEHVSQLKKFIFNTEDLMEAS